jgi:hypothetical protein
MIFISDIFVQILFLHEMALRCVLIKLDQACSDRHGREEGEGAAAVCGRPGGAGG